MSAPHSVVNAQHIPDFATVTSRQQQTWATGDFNVIALNIIEASDNLVRALDPHAGQRILDVACGSGNAALIAARRYSEVTGIDYVPDLITRARQRAAAEGTQVDFREGDAQALPVSDGEFDVVMSVFGVMFAPDQARAAGELLRACRRGGRIGLANWMPQEWGGDLFRALSKYLPPPPTGLKPGVRWGTEEGLRELLGNGTTSIAMGRTSLMQYFRSVDHALDVFFTYYGPTARAFNAANAAGQQALRHDIGAVFENYNEATDGTLVMRCEYLQVVANRA